MMHLPEGGVNTQAPPQLAGTGLALDYIRVQGLARSTLRERFGREMSNVLAAPADPATGMIRVGMAGSTGPRSRHEDSAVAVMAHLVDQSSAIPLILAAVAGGVGGDADGSLASAVAIHVLAESVVRELRTDAARSGGIGSNISSVEDLLLKAFGAAHYAIKARTFGGSTTLTCALIVDQVAYIAHIGDSRAYLLNTEWQDMEIITHDHRRARQWLGFNIATNGELKSHPRGYVLYRVLGKSDDFEIDMTRRSLVNGSRLLLCTSGLWDTVKPAELYSAVHLSNDPQDSCDRLVSLAQGSNARGDMTAVLVGMPD